MLTEEQQKRIIALRDEITYHQRRAQEMQDQLTILLTSLGLQSVQFSIEEVPANKTVGV